MQQKGSSPETVFCFSDVDSDPDNDNNDDVSEEGESVAHCKRSRRDTCENLEELSSGLTSLDLEKKHGLISVPLREPYLDHIVNEVKVNWSERDLWLPHLIDLLEKMVHESKASFYLESSFLQKIIVPSHISLIVWIGSSWYKPSHRPGRWLVSHSSKDIPTEISSRELLLQSGKKKTLSMSLHVTPFSGSRSSLVWCPPSGIPHVLKLDLVELENWSRHDLLHDLIFTVDQCELECHIDIIGGSPAFKL